MANSTASGTTRKAGSAAKQEPYGADHEALLLVAYRELPDVLAEELHAIEPLNSALRKQAPKRAAQIEEQLSKTQLPAEQIALWRKVPHLQFSSDSDFPKPKITLGEMLYRWYDGRGDRKKIPEALCMVDFCIELHIPTWQTGYLQTPDLEEPLKKPADGLCGVGHTLTKHRVLGLVFTESVTLGQAIREIERVKDAGTIDSVTTDYARPVVPFILCVTARHELYDVLRDKVDVMHVDTADYTFEVDLGYLLNQVRVQ